jgi:DNA-binding MarR family transcriptional regulator
MDMDEFSRILLDGMVVLIRVSLQDMMAYIHPKGISMAQMNVLYQLYYRGPCEVLAFTKAHSLSPAGASQLIDRMVRQGWVERVDGSSDRRVHHVHLTELGRQMVLESITARNVWITHFGSKLTSAEREQIGQAFQVMMEKMEG